MDGNHPNRKKDKLNPYILSRQAGRYFLSFKDGQGVQHEIELDELLYNEKELERLFQIVKGDPIELGVILAAFYGLRRSEAVGLNGTRLTLRKRRSQFATRSLRCALMKRARSLRKIGLKRNQVIVPYRLSRRLRSCSTV